MVSSERLYIKIKGRTIKGSDEDEAIKNKQVVIGESTKNIYLQDIEQETQAFILQNNPQLTAESMITLAELLNYRLDYMKQLVANDSEKSNN